MTMTAYAHFNRHNVVTSEAVCSTVCYFLPGKTGEFKA